MKTLMKKLALLTASLMILVVPVLADESMRMNTTTEHEQQGGKDQCLLVSRNCAGQVDSTQERIDRIQNEINKGTSVYTNDELRTLERKLEQENEFLSDMYRGGA